MPTSRELGQATLEVITTADQLPVLMTRLSENGKLVALAVVVAAGIAAPGQVYVEAGVMYGGAGDLYKGAVLVRGWLATGRACGWYGSHPLDPTNRLYLEASSSGAFLVRMTACVEMERVT